MQQKWLGAVMGVALVAAMSMGAAAEPTGGYGGGGPHVGVLSLRLDDLNTKLTGAGFDNLNGNVVVFGGGGKGGTLDWTIGGWGIGGQAQSSNSQKEATLSIGAGGMNIERTLPVGRVTLTGGLMVGGGRAELILVHKANPSLDDAIKNPYETRFTNNFLAVAPTLGLRLKLNSFMFLEAEGGYLATLGKWKFQNQSIAGLPQIGGPMVKVGLVFGGSTDLTPRTAASAE